MTFLQRIGFASGQIGIMVMIRYLFTWNLKFADQRSAEGDVLIIASLAGLVFLAARIFDGITDPVAGLAADSWVRRGRERRTLLWFVAALPAIGLVLIFLPDHAMSSGWKWGTFLGGMFVFFVGYTFYAIPYWSLVEDYSGGSEDERRKLSNILGAALLAATAIVALATPSLVGRLGYLRAAACIAVPGTLLMILPYFSRPDGAKRTIEIPAQEFTVAEQFRALVRHRKFLGFIAVIGGSQMAFTVMTVASPFIVETLLGGREADLAVLMAPFLGTAMPFFIVAPGLSQRFGWERVVVGAAICLAVVYSAAGVLGKAWIGTPLTTAMLLFAFAGPMAAILLGLEAEGIASCAREVEGDPISLYFGIYNLVVKILNGAAVFLTGVLVSWGGHGEHHVIAVRAMPFLAGALLAVGAAGYLWVRGAGAFRAPVASALER